MRSAYLAAASTPEAIAAVCADYRASATADAEHDTADREAGRLPAMPVAAWWQRPVAELPFDPAAVWGSWAPDLWSPPEVAVTPPGGGEEGSFGA